MKRFPWYTCWWLLAILLAGCAGVEAPTAPEPRIIAVRQFPDTFRVYVIEDGDNRVYVTSTGGLAVVPMPKEEKAEKPAPARPGRRGTGAKGEIEY